MPPDEVVTSAPEIAAPTPEPAAAPVADRASKPGKQKFSERMEELGWKPSEPATDNPNSLGAKARASTEPAKEEPDPAEEPTKPDVQKPKPADKPADANAAKREQLAELIKDLGMVMEDGRVTVAERAALRQERREAQERLTRMEAEAMERIGKSAKALEDKTPALKRLEEFDALVSEGDHEAIAKFLGHESYDKWQEHIIALKSDPAYRRLRQLEQQVEADRKAKAEQAERETKEAEERQAREQTEQMTRAEREAQSAYMKGLAETMSTHSDPLIKAMATDPSFVAAVFRVQKSHYDGTGDPMPIEQAIRTPPRGTNANPLMAELKTLYDRLAPVFGQPTPSPAVAIAAAKAGAGKPAPSKVPKTPQPAAVPTPSKTKTDDKAWKDQAARRLAEAVRADMAAERRGTG